MANHQLFNWVNHYQFSMGLYDKKNSFWMNFGMKNTWVSPWMCFGHELGENWVGEKAGRNLAINYVSHFTHYKLGKNWEKNQPTDLDKWR